MKAMNLSAKDLKAYQTIASADTAELLFQAATTDFLVPFMHDALSIKEASEYLGLPFMKVHYQVKKFCKHGLLEVVDEFEQKGRNRHRYRASAQGFFVPFKVTKAYDLKGFLREQDAPWYDHMLSTFAFYLLQSAFDPDNMGVHLHLANETLFRLSLTDDPTKPQKNPFPEDVYAMSDESFKLSAEDAADMKREIGAVLNKYRTKETGQSYQVRFFCLPSKPPN